MAPSMDRWNTSGTDTNWTVGGAGHWMLLLGALAVFGMVLLLLGMQDLAKTIWPLWTGGTAVGLAYLAWQTDHWPGVRDSTLGIEVASGGAALAVLLLAVMGIIRGGLLHASNFFFVRFGAILIVGTFIGAAVYFWFYLFTTKAKKRTAETMRILSIAVLGITLWGPYFFANVDIAFGIAHFLIAIWAGVTASGQAVAEDTVARQLGD
jgi:hypothetical protein